MRLTQAGLELVASKFRALSDPTRLAILQCLMQGEQSVSSIVEETAASQPNVSRHLGVLLRAGLVARRKAWPHSLYSVSDPAIETMCQTMCASIERGWVELYPGEPVGGEA